MSMRRMRLKETTSLEIIRALLLFDQIVYYQAISRKWLKEYAMVVRELVWSYRTGEPSALPKTSRCLLKDKLQGEATFRFPRRPNLSYIIGKPMVSTMTLIKMVLSRIYPLDLRKLCEQKSGHPEAMFISERGR